MSASAFSLIERGFPGTRDSGYARKRPKRECGDCLHLRKLFPVSAFKHNGLVLFGFYSLFGNFLQDEIPAKYFARGRNPLQ